MKKLLLVALMLVSSILHSKDQNSWEYVYSIYFAPRVWGGVENVHKVFMKLEKKVVKGKEFLRFKKCSGSTDEKTLNCVILGKKEGYLSSRIIPDILPSQKEMDDSYRTYMEHVNSIDFYNKLLSPVGAIGVPIVSGTLVALLGAYFDFNFFEFFNKHIKHVFEASKWGSNALLWGIGAQLGVLVYGTGALFIVNEYNKISKDLSLMPMVYVSENKELYFFNVSFKYLEMIILSL